MGSWAGRTGAEGSGREMPEQDLSLDWMLKESRHHIAPKHGHDRSFRCPEATCTRKGTVWPRLDNFRQHLKRMHQLEPTDEVIAKAEQGVHDREELPQQGSSLDWMLDSSHVNVGLWNHFDGHRFVTEEQGVHDREELQQQGSSLDRSLPPSHVNVDLLRRLDRRAFRPGEQGIIDRAGGLRGRLDTKCFDPSDIALDLDPRGTALDFSGTFNNAKYHNTSAGFIQDDPSSWTSGSTASFTNSLHEQPIEISRSIFDESDYNHVGRPALGDDYGRYLHDFEMGYGYPYLFDRTFQTFPLVDEPSDYGKVTTDFKDWYNPDTDPDNIQIALAKRGEKSHADVLPSPMDSSHQLQESVSNQSFETYFQMFPEVPWASPSILSSDRSFNRQRCNYPRRYNREADPQRHMAAHHPTRKVWITVDISPDKKFLAHCEACRTGKKYERYSNAAAHLRETHFSAPKGLPSLETIREGGVYLPPTIKVLNEWLKEVDEVTDREPQVTHSAAPELPVFEDGRSVDKNSRSMHKKQRTNREYGGPKTDNPYQLSFATTDQSLARFPKYPITVENASMTSNRSTKSIQSIDSGYISDLTILDCNLKTERYRDTCSKAADDGNLSVKEDPAQPDPEMEVSPPKAESGSCLRMEVKRESSKALDEMANIKEWRECSNEGERFSNKTDPGIDGYKDGDLASAKPDLNQYQQPSEQRNLKRKRDSYLASASAITSAGDKSETSADLFRWQSSSLARHRQTHTGKRPYKCSAGQCDKSFCRKTTLMKHAQRAHQMSTDNQHSKEESCKSESEESPVTKPHSTPQSHWPHPDQSNSQIKGLAGCSIDNSQSVMGFKAEPMTLFSPQESHSAAVQTSYTNDEEGPARLKVNKKHQLKDSICTVKAEPDSVEAPSITTAPVITFNMEPSHPKHRNTVPLPFGHPKSRQWMEMLPSIKACTREIMGKGNRGALELFLVNEEPTICITCWDPLKLNLALVSGCMEPLGLRINITQGKIDKSASDEHDGSSGAAVSDQGQCMFSSSVHGHYMQRPTCGASLGTADGPLKSGKVSLGGYLKIKHLYRRHWSYYAMTVHHILVSDDRKDHSLSITGNDEDEEMAEPGYDYSPGVCNGVYEFGDGSGVRVTLSCPAVPDVRSLVARLEGRRIKRCANESYAAIDDLDNLDDLLNKVYTREGTRFGNAAWSSGLCLDQDVEMDWLLIGDLPVGRIGCNNPGDVNAYMEGSQQASIHKGCWTPSAYVDESAFSTLMSFSAEEWGKPGSEGGYLSRVFGRGSETGLADGFLSPHPSIFYDETYGPYDAWAFAPRRPYGLGDSGDSGTWIFTSEGKLLGQIISYNRARHITYFTPICKIFNHIKRITGATDVELLTPQDVVENLRVTPRSAGGLLSPEEETSNPNKCSTSTTTNIGSSVDSSAAPKRFLSPPRTPASFSQPLTFPPSHVRGSTTGLPTPGSTQTSDSSD